jgi:sugar O-acyltransferase (sialic acid O-acetyltransferase NeuD family)
VRLVLFAVSTPFASELMESARRAGLDPIAVTNRPDIKAPAEVGNPLDADSLPGELLELPFIVCQAQPRHRHAAMADARTRGLSKASTLVDPTAIVAATAVIKPGVYVGAGSVVAAGARLGAGSLVNRSCSIGHHSVLEDYACTGPGIVVAGSCRVERGAFIGAGAVLAPEVRIGAGALVGAGAVVIRDVAPGEVVAGNPARVLRVDPTLAVPKD